MSKEEKKIVVVGLGYVGLPLAVLAKQKKYNITGIVKNSAKAELINKGICPFKEEALSKKLKLFPIETTTDFSVVSDAKIIIVCVPTPVLKNHHPDFEPLISASVKIGQYLSRGSLVILESTVNPGATETVMIPILEITSHLKAGVDFYVSHCPERINPGDKNWNVENIPRVVGSLNEKGLKMTVDFYQSILKSKIKSMESIKEAEAVKIVENCFRDINIAFVNELAMSFNNLGIDVVNVLEGAATKPFAFLKHSPGCGVGGHCIPVDPYYLIDFASKQGFEHSFLSLARKINTAMPEYTINLLLDAIKRIGKKNSQVSVLILGLAYKGNIDDIRESPSFELIRILKEKGIDFDVYDPYIPDKSTVKSIEEALKNKDAILLASNHFEFANLKPKLLFQKGIKIVIDGKNFFDKKEFIKSGIDYQGIGR
jgi:UDP-N-acetyl-D-glucosamine dehydrogenase